MIEGASGLLACARRRHAAGLRAVARAADLAERRQGFVYSARDPEGLRGPSTTMPGATRSPSGRTRRGGLGQPAASGCGAAAAARAGDDDAAGDAAGAGGWSARADVAVTRGTTATTGMLAQSFVRRCDRALRRHPARAAGAGRRADRGGRGRAVDAGRCSRRVPRRTSASPAALEGVVVTGSTRRLGARRRVRDRGLRRSATTGSARVLDDCSASAAFARGLGARGGAGGARTGAPTG